MPASQKTLSARGRRDDLACELRALRNRSGLTLAALAQRTCYSKSSWERYLNGKSLPSEAAVRAFAEAVRVSPARLLVLRSLADEEGGEPTTTSPDETAPGDARTPDAATVEREPGAALTTAAATAAAAPATAHAPAPAQAPATAAEPATTMGAHHPSPVGRRRWAVPALCTALGLFLGIGLGFGLSALLREAPSAVAGADPGRAAFSRDARPQRCVGFECTGKDPERYGCAEKVWTAAMRKVGETYVQLRYSPTCQAAWGRIVHADVGDVAVVEGPKGRTEKRPLSYGHDVYTPMVDAPFPASVRACIEFKGGDKVCTEQGGASPAPYTTAQPARS